VATHVRHPVWLTSTPDHAAWAFALLFFVESVARASVATVLPINAYDLFGDKESVSLAYTAVAFCSLVLSLAIPYIIRALSRRWSYTLGATCLILCGAALATNTVSGQLLSMLARTFGAATLNVTLNLYIMDYIRKTELVRAEPLRYGISTAAWIAAPLGGVWLYDHYGIAATGVVPVASALMLIGLFWYLRMSERGPIRPARMLPPNPLASVGRFARQPRLRLAWFIAFARSAFWVTFFVYVPILMIEGGLGALTAGIAIAVGNAMLLNNFLASGWARRYGLRRVIALAAGCGGAMSVAAGIAGSDHAAIAATFLVLGSFFIATLDGLGPIPFMRAVHAYERPQMTAIYRTYLDASELIPPFVYFLAFMAFGFSGAFYTLALLLSATAWLSWRYLPGRL
jgi:MFS family permease